MAGLYCDYNHKRSPAYWMVVPDNAAAPTGIRKDDWSLVGKRPAAGLSHDGRKQVDHDGFAIIRVGISLEELVSL